MKKILLMAAVLTFLAGEAYADMSTTGDQAGPKDYPMMGQMRCQEMREGKSLPMMGQMMGMGMVMQNMMKVIQDVALIQDRLVTGMTEEEKKTARQDLKALRERIDRMMLEMPGMMMKGAAGGHQHGASPKEGPKKDEAAKPQEHKH